MTRRSKEHLLRPLQGRIPRLLCELPLRGQNPLVLHCYRPQMGKKPVFGSVRDR